MRKDDGSNIETVRAVATLLLVAYHAIGLTQSGLRLDNPHPLRIAADLLVDVRMPLFAFIAGWVYALRPVSLATYRNFATGKMRRLYLPGVVAAVTYWVIATYIVPGALGAGAPFVSVLSLSYLHFWFLQAILIILFAFALIDALAPKHSELLFLAVFCLPLFLFPPFVPNLELNTAGFLSPYFLFGVAIQRRRAMFGSLKPWIASAAFLALAVAVAISAAHFAAHGSLPADRKDLQSLLFSFSAITLLVYLLPRWPALSVFGATTFTIYLYHIIGTSGFRRVAVGMGLQNEYLVFLISFLGGLIVPLLIYTAASRWDAASRFLLGRPRRTVSP